MNVQQSQTSLDIVPEKYPDASLNSAAAIGSLNVVTPTTTAGSRLVASFSPLSLAIAGGDENQLLTIGLLGKCHFCDPSGEI
jgi:hypothetical protein